MLEGGESSKVSGIEFLHWRVILGDCGDVFKPLGIFFEREIKCKIEFLPNFVLLVKR